MSVKSYLQDQIRLVSLSGYDLFTEEEYDLYMQIIKLGKEIDKLYAEEKPKEEIQPFLDEKRKVKSKMEELIRSHKGVPRTVRVASVMTGDEIPAGVTWYGLKNSKRIAEFACELSRAMGLEVNEATLDLIVLKWKNLDELEQIVVDGIYMPILTPEGVENRHYRFYTASAGQLRRDKIQLISDKAWETCHRRLECGLDWDEINRRGGINVN